MNDDVFLEFWVIYESPADFPGQFVLRRWWNTNAGETRCDHEPLAVADRLDGVREKLPPFLTLFPHVRGEHECIIETWV